MIIYIEVLKLAKTRFLISISDKKEHLFFINVFNGTQKQAVKFAEISLKNVKKQYGYDARNKTIHTTPRINEVLRL